MFKLGPKSGYLRAGAAFLCAAGILNSVPAVADFDAPPKPKPDCTKRANQDKPACRPHHATEFSDDEIYNAAYWMARDGKYKEALSVLGLRKERLDPRLLTVEAYSLRKLGLLEAALPLYARALSIDPNFLPAREHLGEAFLAMGKVGQARDQLREIGRRGGAASPHYAKLAFALAEQGKVRQGT